MWLPQALPVQFLHRLHGRRHPHRTGVPRQLGQHARLADDFGIEVITQPARHRDAGPRMRRTIDVQQDRAGYLHKNTFVEEQA
jgi:hypothetical protein